jgi:molybdate transport system substrate-binding protein
VPGVDVVGPLPTAIQQSTIFSAALCMSSRQVAAVQALLAFLASPQADETKRRHGMEPA